VVAGVVSRCKGAVEVEFDEFFGRFGLYTDKNFNILGVEELARPPTHAAGENEIDAVFVEPTGQHSGGVVRRFETLAAESFVFFVVDLDDGKFLTVPKVFGENTPGEWDGNFHEFLLKFMLQPAFRY